MAFLLIPALLFGLWERSKRKKTEQAAQSLAESVAFKEVYEKGVAEGASLAAQARATPTVAGGVTTVTVTSSKRSVEDYETEGVITSAMCGADKCENLVSAEAAAKRSTFDMHGFSAAMPHNTIPNFYGRVSGYLSKSNFDPVRDKFIAVTNAADNSLAVYPTERNVSEETLNAVRQGWSEAANVTSAHGGVGPNGDLVDVGLSQFDTAKFLQVSGAFEVPANSLHAVAPLAIG